MQMGQEETAISLTVQVDLQNWTFQENEGVHFITDSDNIKKHILQKDVRVQEQQKLWKVIFYTKTQDYKGNAHFIAQNYYRKYQKNLDERLAVPKKKKHLIIMK